MVMVTIVANQVTLCCWSKNNDSKNFSHCSKNVKFFPFSKKIFALMKIIAKIFFKKGKNLKIFATMCKIFATIIFLSATQVHLVSYNVQCSKYFRCYILALLPVLVEVSKFEIWPYSGTCWIEFITVRTNVS